MSGPEILVRTLSRPNVEDRTGRKWQYHSRSDHHSKVACWGIVFDLLKSCPLLRRHVADGRVKFGINHEMRDFQNDRKKNLDLVLCLESSALTKKVVSPTLTSMVAHYGIDLSPSEERDLAALPELVQAPVGSVLLALEAKACMTAHQRALPRLYDELNSSHLTVHGATDQAIAAGFVMVNMAEHYLSPDMNKQSQVMGLTWSSEAQPRSTSLAVDKVKQLPRRARVGDVGYDALAIAVINCKNDGSTVRLVGQDPAPQLGDIYHYDSMIDRLGHIYATRFRDL